ncbi:hematopoietic SH2 domain-containing protein homolog [Toxotes jaculatrix]|uniref:hematopoietic SH2 domain-containing protein homolog n=1 Tax=Toxotes jaculatrix TaxID=941984 RepID=UPI001B3A9939|nr:hematopoietic SH2 domain-containing protein homolog [Toxotes jaculatrix]XP_040897201.1 hematopoietic SH2 domain-containing protein homolog [Toxotes jaculatrix]
MMEWRQSLQGQHEAFTWFTKSQLQTVIRNGVVPDWFHGIISRKMAEELLMPKPPGYFLIRVSETRIGYTLSYRADDRCRHFMIDVLEDGHYIIVGENRRHRFLQDLVDFHRRTPIMPFSELLTVACGQSSNDKTDYAELLFPQRPPKPNASLIHHDTVELSRTPPVSQEEIIPPALPYRPYNLSTSAVLSPSSQPDRLYPCLEEEFPQPASTLPPTPVPFTRKRYTADNPPSNQPPEVPARSFVPPLKQNQACVRTVSAPEGPSTPTAPEHPLGGNIRPVKNHEVKPSVVTNLKNLKKKFQKKRSTSQEHMYMEINVETTERSTESEYQEITEEQITHTNVTLSDEALPLEYLPPPPFAPGY